MFNPIPDLAVKNTGGDQKQIGVEADLRIEKKIKEFGKKLVQTTHSALL